MNSFNRTILVLGLLLPMVFTLAPSQIRLDPDGGYTGIVIKIDKEVPEEMCTQILSNLQVRTHQFICRDKKYKTPCTMSLCTIISTYNNINLSHCNTQSVRCRCKTYHAQPFLVDLVYSLFYIQHIL